MARTRKTSKSTELLAQPDPRAALDVGHFLAVAQHTLDLLTDDLLARADESPAITEALKARHQHEKSKQLTADAYPVWRRGIVVQIAAAWLLSCVFVRTLEDRGLLARNRLAGPGAIDAQRAFFQLAPHLGLREYLLTIFAELDHFPAVERLFDRDHNLAWRLAPSPEGAKALVELFRGPDPEQPHFRFGQPSTRFLGDLYQDISEDVRKRYALLQTPDFVESFILDRTLEPAIAEFGLRETTLIDPTCGSGHFLLGGFERLFAHWSTLEPNGSDAAHVERALASVFGVDINPYAVFIAQFRLTLAALGKLQVAKIAQAPELPIHVVVADSLLHNYDKGQAGFGDMFGQTAATWYGEEFALEDEDEAKRVLQRGYAAVVGNPPYITVKDAALRDRYRAIYSAAYREYSLSVPFMQRFFGLARDGGFVGQITSNSFMKREFGKKLIEDYLPTVDLQLIANTSGAFIPGHGTPTVMLFGRSRTPESPRVAAVLARRGEPTTPEDPAQGLVWSSIRDHWDEDGFENEYVTVAEVERELLAGHPWSLEGGGAGELKALLEARAETTLESKAASIGFMCITKQDDVFSQPTGTFQRWGTSAEHTRPFVIGELVRDWKVDEGLEVFFPYDTATAVLDLEAATLAPLWKFRTILESRAVFGGKTFREAGKRWYEYGQIPQGRTEGMSIGFAFVATHNHFVLDRGGKVFNRSAPIIKLPESATEDDHLALLAYLNSSTACFWMKQVSHDKGSGTEKGGRQADPAKGRFEFTGTHLQQLPVPALTNEGRQTLAERSTRAMNLAAERQALPGLVLAGSLEPAEAANLDALLLRQIIALQEQIDWIIYHEFLGGTTIDTSTFPSEINLGQRPFEFNLAAMGQTLGLDGQSLGGELPQSWAPEQRKCFASLIEHSKSSALLRLIERPEYKRRFEITPKDLSGAVQTFDMRLCLTLLEGLQDMAEQVVQKSESLVGHSSLNRSLPSRFEDIRQIVERHGGEPPTVGGSLEADAIPFLAAQRFTEAGLEKHAAWQQTWALQRREDAGEKVGDIPVPPKYDQKDFRDATAWRLRGKLDVPKERFIAYPGCESDQDNEPIYGWAGWNHAQRAEALLALYTARKTEEAWSTERLTPILAGIHELIPWLVQWHNEPDPDTGERLGDAYDAWLGEELRAHGLTRADLDAWRPVKKSAAKPKTASKSATKPAASDDPANLAKKKPGRKKKTAKAEDA